MKVYVYGAAAAAVLFAGLLVVVIAAFLHRGEDRNPRGGPRSAEPAPRALKPGTEDGVGPAAGDVEGSRPRLDLSIRGRVVDRDGSGVPGIRVEAFRLLSRAGRSARIAAERNRRGAASDEEGSFEIDGLGEGIYEVRTGVTESYPSVKKAVRAGGEPVELVVLERRAVRIAGTISAKDGRRLQGVSIRSEGQPESETRSGPNGAYSIELELAGPESAHVLRFEREGYHGSIVEVRGREVWDAEVLDLDVVLEPAGPTAPVTGTIVDANGLAARGETVLIQSPSLGIRLQQASDEEGRFSFREVPVAEDYRLWIHPTGNFRDFVIPSVAIPRQGIRVDVVLEPLALGRVHGQMVDGDGKPVPGLMFTLQSLQALGKSFEVKCDGEGRFDLGGIPEGSLTLWTKTSPRFTVRDVELPAGAEAFLRPVLDRGNHEIAGKVTGSRGDPVAGASVELYTSLWGENFRSLSYRETRSDEGGRFSFDGLGRGPHKIKVTCPGYRIAQINWDVGSPEPPPAIRLIPAAGSPGGGAGDPK